MKPHEAINKINQAMVNDDLEAAEKALEDYVINAWNWFDKNEFFKMDNGTWESSAIYPMCPSLNINDKQLYQLFINQ